jgi:4-hydroxy-tetrahydrodipicolinate synthase
MPHTEIAGIIPPLVTPFTADEELDEQAHRAEVRYQIEQARVHGLAVTGSTGEGYALTNEEVRKVTAWTVEEARDRVPVITGVIANSTRAAIERGRAVADLGVVALQVTPVHYLFAPDEDASIAHFDAIAQATGLPVIIYNVIPWAYLSPARLARILREAPGVIGVKQSASDVKTLADLLMLVGDRARIFSAVDALLYPSFALGAHGSISAIVTAAPEWCVELWNAVRQGDHTKALALHHRLLRLWNALDAPNLPANVKAAMALQSRCGGHPRRPMPETSPERRERIRAALA